MTPTSETCRFVLDGRIVSIERPDPTMTVLEYLREVAGLRGTKEGCAEGDCGACTVVLGELAADRSQVTYRAVNSCIRFVPTIDGKELVTVESLRQSTGDLHPVQRSMVDHHGSQCGFCTPGFVMSLFALYLQQEAAGRDQIVDALSGNLCRCTGYRPIIEAGLRQWDYPAPARWSRTESQSPRRIEALAGIARGATPAESLRYPGFHAPRTALELAGALAEHPDSVLLAGGTDVGLWVTKQLRDLPALLYLGDIPEFSQVERRPQELWIGAAVTLTDAWPALLERYPALAEQMARFASPPIRNSATLCGNLANGSPIGDSIPMLMALGARLELRGAGHMRRVPLEDFYLGYMRKLLAPGEFIAGVAIPRTAAAPLIASYKVSKRIDQDISAVSATFCVDVEGTQVRDARLAYGGLAGIACRARRAEQALQARGWSAAGIDAAVAELPADFQPLSDLRAGRDYRLRAAGNLLRRFHAEHRRSGVALRTRDASPLGVSPA
jgi:xanthine dehydrogenase small subunit